MSPIEFKRKVTWLWRLSCSQLSRHIVNAGCVNALWVFDTAHQPDGGVLQPYMEEVARREGLLLRSFGPGRASFGERLRHTVEFVSRLHIAFRADFEVKFASSVCDKIKEAFANVDPSVLLVGASKGTFATIAKDIDINFEVWEVQHGLLDQSYFPMNVHRFYARSQGSARIIEYFEPQINVKILDCSLDPPEGYIGSVELSRVSELVCFSKNPGGGCTAQELAIFELACYLFANQLQCKFSLQLHPRDSVFKLLWRHRRIRVLNWIRTSREKFCSQPRLIISAYSSALITESRKGDVIMNVIIEKAGEVTRLEYQWLPTVDVQEMAVLSGTIHAFIRTQ